MSAAVRSRPTRRDFYTVYSSLRETGHTNARIAQVLGRPETFVETLDKVRQWPESKRAAWLLGLNVDKFRCV